MLLDQMMAIFEKFTKELKESDPEKRDHFIKSSLDLFEVSTELLRVSPEFRKGFAQVHGEFLKHPESKQTIELALESYRRFLKQH